MEATMATEQDTDDGIEIVAVEGLALHRHYARQTSPQPCYVELDTETGRLRCVVSGEIGSGVPVRVWHGIVQRWRIPALKADAANALLDELRPLAAEVYEGTRTVWDGSNHVGRLDDAARAAADAIEQAIQEHEPWDEHERVSVWDAGDWYGGLGGEAQQRRELGIDAATSERALDVLVEREDARAAAEGVDVLEGLDRHLRRLRDDAIEALVEDVEAASEYVAGEDLPAAVRLWLAWWGAPDAAQIAAAYDAVDDALAVAEDA
jgi:hypothetical protein